MSKCKPKVRALALECDFRAAKVHEAGHALGKLLAAPNLGRKEHEAIARIDFTNSIATTCGPMLSVEMEACVRETYGTREDGTIAITSLTREQIRKACKELDTNRWMQAKLLETAMGPAAEARFLGKQIDEVLAMSACKGDCRDLVVICWMAGIDDTHEMVKPISVARARAVHVVSQETEWEAINQLADALPNRGSFDGKKAIEILATALRSRDSVGLNDG